MSTEEEHKLETFGRIPNFSVCCAKANGHGPFHTNLDSKNYMCAAALLFQAFHLKQWRLC